MKCSKCNSLNVACNTAIESILHNGHELHVEMDYSFCQECEREFVSTEQILVNDKRVQTSIANIKQ